MILTIAKDIRAELYAANQQGRRPTCLSFAASDAHRHARRHAAPLSVEWLFYHAGRRARTGPANGTTIPDTRAVLKEVGQPEEAVWPYVASQPASSNWHPPAVTSGLLTCSSSGCGSDLGLLRDHIDDHVPVVIGMFISNTFLFPHTWARSGGEVILARDASEPIDHGRGHAMVVVGHGNVDGVGVFLLRNSWGGAWGNQGHAWIYEDYLALRLAGAFTLSKGGGDVLQSDGSLSDAHPGARMG